MAQRRKRDITDLQTIFVSRSWIGNTGLLLSLAEKKNSETWTEHRLLETRMNIIILCRGCSSSSISERANQKPYSPTRQSVKFNDFTKQQTAFAQNTAFEAVRQTLNITEDL